jgi:hypothetical protein
MGTHARWHDFALTPLNPIALIEFIDRLEPCPHAARIIGYICAVTGINMTRVREAASQTPEA